MTIDSQLEAYLDIETTGLCAGGDAITVVGVFIDGQDGGRVVQLVGDDITRSNLLDTMEGVGKLFTYNGSRFDLPFIRTCLGVDLCRRHSHHDLMYDCWGQNLKGGLKKVEARLGIERNVKGVDGFEAVRLWWRYKYRDDKEALDTLLAYNREDVVNLKALRSVLASRACL